MKVIENSKNPGKSPNEYWSQLLLVNVLVLRGDYSYSTIGVPRKHYPQVAFPSGKNHIPQRHKGQVNCGTALRVQKTVFRELSPGQSTIFVKRWQLFEIEIFGMKERSSWERLECLLVGPQSGSRGSKIPFFFASRRFSGLDC
jgi:hypothetical protein